MSNFSACVFFRDYIMRLLISSSAHKPIVHHHLRDLAFDHLNCPVGRIWLPTSYAFRTPTPDWEMGDLVCLAIGLRRARGVVRPVRTPRLLLLNGLLFLASAPFTNIFLYRWVLASLDNNLFPLLALASS